MSEEIKKTKTGTKTGKKKSSSSGKASNSGKRADMSRTVKSSSGVAEASNGTSRRKKKRKKKMVRNIILFSIEALVLIVLAVVLYFVIAGTTNVSHIDINDGDDIASNETLISDEVNNVFQSTVVSAEDGTETTLAEKYKQVALFGVDSREGQLEKSTRTDSIMIASINLETNEVKLCSVFRDTYLNLTTDSYNKCNSAYAKGGPRQAINMLNTNLDLNIDDFVTVGFKGVVETVDSLGGVSIDISDAEIGYLNDYQFCIAEDLGLPTYTKVQSEGIQTLNGLQACAYCRIRYTAGDDFKRAERQRNVVEQMINKAKVADPGTLATVATDAFKNVATSFDISEILTYAADAPKYSVVGSNGFPFDKDAEGNALRVCATIGNKGSCVIPTNLATNVTLLHEFLFDVKDYVPTSIVQECSDEIEKQTAPYL